MDTQESRLNVKIFLHQGCMFLLMNEKIITILSGKIYFISRLELALQILKRVVWMEQIF